MYNATILAGVLSFKECDEDIKQKIPHSESKRHICIVAMRQ